ncbi:MAG: type II toxin-antitoxin system VapC family toxin, partial [Spirochaetota bacterium]
MHEFLAIVTHPRIYSPPTPLVDALTQVERWKECPSFTFIGEESAFYFYNLRHILETSQVSGARIHDARIAAICVAHGVDELWTADRDFSRFPGLNVKNPLV